MNKSFAWLILLALPLLLSLTAIDAYAKANESTSVKKKKVSKKSIAAKRAVSKKPVTKNRRATTKQANITKRPVKRAAAAASARSKFTKRIAPKRANYAKQASRRKALSPVIHFGTDPSDLKSAAAYIYDVENAQSLYSKNADEALPIASLTKLMTALVVLEGGQDMDEVLEVTRDDIDTIKHTSSRLPIGARLSRSDMLHIALMSSENRAASALGRHYPGGLPAFVNAMNGMSILLGMEATHFVEPTGLSPQNVSSARDLVRLVSAAQAHPLIRQYSTHRTHAVDIGNRVLQYRNTNRMVSYSTWDIALQKTGYIAEAGRCLIMQADIQGRAVVMVFLGSQGKFSRTADASTMRHWLEKTKLPQLADATVATQG
jgi:serine-type D-Ala-D-Ala endopeptidase (penicillin-binding protein 7)